MKIKTVKTQYGFINFAEVAGIDISKDKTLELRYNPEFIAYNKYIGNDTRIDDLKSSADLDDFQKDNYSWYYNSVFCFPLAEINKDWHIVNRDFASQNAKECDPQYLNRMIKAKTCPIAVDKETFMKWFVKVYHCLNDTWKSENRDYVDMMEQRILDNNRALLEAFKNQDIKTIRASVKLSADINFEENGKSPLGYAVAYQNTDLVKYLVNKKVVVPQDLVLDDTNPVAELLKKQFIASHRKFKMK